MELNFYCRKRQCVFHNRISKKDNVLCSKNKPEILSDKDGMKRCFSYKKKPQVSEGKK